MFIGPQRQNTLAQYSLLNNLLSSTMGLPICPNSILLNMKQFIHVSPIYIMFSQPVALQMLLSYKSHHALLGSGLEEFSE